MLILKIRLLYMFYKRMVLLKFLSCSFYWILYRSFMFILVNYRVLYIYDGRFGWGSRTRCAGTKNKNREEHIGNDSMYVAL